MCSIESNSPKVKDDKSIVTPYAFSVSDCLLNIPLASPIRRLCAVSIDMCIIGLFSMSAGLFLSSISAYGAYSLSIKEGRSALAKYLYLLLFASLVGLTCVLGYSLIRENYSENEAELVGSHLNTKREEMNLNACETDECRIALAKMIKVLLEPSNTGNDKQHIEDFVRMMALSNKEKSDLIAAITATRPKFGSVELEEKVTTKATPPAEEAAVRGSQGFNINFDEEGKNNGSSIGIIAWVKAFLRDLGIGFGLAMLYFSVLTTLMQGQTFGKRLLGIRVVLLDGSTPSLWQAFGRYGGYGAGFATGLLGFLQIFWDPNRQAIQDKISETLVIKAGHVVANHQMESNALISDID